MAYTDLELELYQGTPPNRGNGLHIYAPLYTGFKNALTDVNACNMTLFKSYTADKYTFNNNIFIFSASDTEEIGFKKVTYIVEFTRKTGLITYANRRCFFVDNVKFQSGNVILYCSLDYWGTYINDAVFYNMHVTRCNRKIANGIYDEVKTGKGNKTIYNLLPTSLSLTECSVVFLMDYNESQNDFTGEAITRTSLFGCDLKYIFDKIHDLDATKDSVDIVDKVIDVIGGIHALSAGAYGTDVKAQVLKMWLVPTSAITRISASFNPRTKCLMTNGQDFYLGYISTILPSVYSEEIDIKQCLNDLPTAWEINFMPKYHIEIGTPYNGMPLTRFTDDTKVYFKYIFGNSSLRVVVVQGTKEKEITEGYEVSMTTNALSKTSLENISKVIGETTKAIMNVAMGFARGGVGGGLVSAGLEGISYIKSLSQNINHNSVDAGNGALTFYKGDASAVNSPYCLMLTESNEDEKEKARLYGANFDFMIEALSTANLESKTLLGSYNGITPNGTFIAVDDFQAHGLPDDAERYIRAEFERGIYFKLITI